MITAIFANAAKSGPICGCSLKLPSPMHFAFTQNAINQSLGHTLELGAQEVVDTLAGILRRDLQQLHCGDRRGRICHPSIITIFYGIEALNDYCYIRERRQKRSDLRMFAKTAIPHRAQSIQDVRPSDGSFAAKAVNEPETNAFRYDAR